MNCYICHQLIEDSSKAHDVHAKNCPASNVYADAPLGQSQLVLCGCDFKAHAECCPACLFLRNLT